MFKSFTKSSIFFIVSAFSCFGQINSLESFQNRWHKYIDTELENAPEWSKSGWHFGNDISRPTIDSSLSELGAILWNKYNDQNAMNISDSCIPTIDAHYNWLLVNEAIKSDITAERAYENLKAKYNVTELQKAISDANIYMNGLKVVEFLTKIWRENQDEQPQDTQKGDKKLCQYIDKKEKSNVLDQGYKNAIMAINEYKDDTSLQAAFAYVATQPPLPNKYYYFKDEIKLTEETPEAFVIGYLNTMRTFNYIVKVKGEENEILKLDDCIKWGLMEILCKKLTPTKPPFCGYVLEKVNFNKVNNPDEFLRFLCNSYLIYGVDVVDFEYSQITDKGIRILLEQIKK